MLYSGESSVLFSYINPQGWMGGQLVSALVSFHLRMKDLREKLGGGEEERKREREKKEGLANGCIDYRQKTGVTPYYQSSNLTPASR